MKPMHISLDFWNTIATPNPKYTRMRNEYLAQYYGRPVDEVRTIYTSIKSRLDDEAARDGLSTPWCDIHIELAEALRPDDWSCTKWKSHEFSVNALMRLFKDNPPIIDPELIFMLERAYRFGHTLSIASNTNFVNGDILREILEQHTDKFLFMLFSDEIQCSKPHIDFARSIAGMTNHLYSNRPIIHVGDSLECDGGMEGICDISFQHVSNPQQTLEFLKTL